MFESVNNSTPNTMGCNYRGFSGQVNHFKAARQPSNTRTGDPRKSNRSGADTPSQSTPEQLKKDLPGLRDVVLQFSIHEKTGRTMIKIVDKENNEVIREIPSGEDLERSARLRMYVGLLFDAIA